MTRTSAYRLGLIALLTGCSAPGADTDGKIPPNTSAASTSAAPRTSAAPGATTAAPGATAASTAANPVASSKPSASSATTSNPGPSTNGSIGPGTPQVLADGLLFPGRIALNAGKLFFASRVGYPATQGLEELWTVATSGGPAQLLATPGNVSGLAYVNDEVWIAAGSQRAVLRIDATSGASLGSITTDGAPYQVATNSTTAFASLYDATEKPALVSIPHSTRAPGVLWGSAEHGLPLWLNATDEALFFTTQPYLGTSSVFRIDLATGSATELAVFDKELGAVEVVGNTIWFTVQGDNAVWQRDLTNNTSMKFATIPGAWAVRADGDYLYVSGRPEFCTRTEPDAGAVYRVPLAGGTPEKIADRLRCPSQLVADAKGLYWINNGTWAGTSAVAPLEDGAVLFLPRSE